MGTRCLDGGTLMRLWAGVAAKNRVKLHWLDGLLSAQMQGDSRRSFDTMALQVIGPAGIFHVVPVKSNKINRAGAFYGIRISGH